MEDVLCVYARPYDRAYPVVVMDEKPLQLLDDAVLSMTILPSSSGGLATSCDPGSTTLTAASRDTSERRLRFPALFPFTCLGSSDECRRQ